MIKLWLQKYLHLGHPCPGAVRPVKTAPSELELYFDKRFVRVSTSIGYRLPHPIFVKGNGP